MEEGVKDEFNDAAFNFAIVGFGQGGSRLAESFWNLGIQSRVGIINTAQQDLSLNQDPRGKQTSYRRRREPEKTQKRQMKSFELDMKTF